MSIIIDTLAEIVASADESTREQWEQALDYVFGPAEGTPAVDDADVATTSHQYRAHFTPQMWLNDHALDVEPQGPTSWIVSEKMLGEAARIVAAGFADGLDCDDVLINDPAAPEWVRDWDGPFSIFVERRGEER